MKKMMLIGRSGCGKSTLRQALAGEELRYRKTQAVIYCDSIIDTPGEFLENRSFYSALLVTAHQCDLVGMVQAAGDTRSIFPPGFAALFPRQVVGIISKLDQCSNPARAEAFLKQAGIEQVIATSAVAGVGLAQLRKIVAG